MIPAGTAVACLLVFAVFVCVVILDGIHLGEYRPRARRMYRTRTNRPARRALTWELTKVTRRSRRVGAALPRRPARLAPEDRATVAWLLELRQPPTWTAAMLRARLTVLAHIIGLAQIPPTETPDPQPQLDYDATRTDWAEIRKELFAMLATDGGDS